MTGFGAAFAAGQERAPEAVPAIVEQPAETTQWQIDAATLGRYRELCLGRDGGGFQCLDESLRRVRTYGRLDLALPPARKAAGARPRIILGDGVAGFQEWSAARFPALTYDYGDVASGLGMSEPGCADGGQMAVRRAIPRVPG